jgi:DNA invertase Pin-like site-specific DNA recombinase
MMSAKKILSAYAISYLRFSSVIQGRGDSRTRQNASRDRWLESHPEIPLKREMNDLGLSAFTGKHVAQGDLGDFLALCETEEFRAECARRDVYLLVENLDRLSRERILKALGQLQGILESGVKVVTLCDGKTYDSKSLDSVGEVMMAVCSMARAHEESLIKSDRNCSAWKKQRKEIRAGEKTISKVLLPTWIRKEGKGFKVNAKAAKVVRRVFEFACEGKNITTIARVMNQEGHPTLNFLRRGTGEVWNLVTINNLLNDRKVIGEIQLRKFIRDENDDYVRDEKGRRQKEDSGDPIKGYYPAIIDPATFAKARKLVFRNFSRRGRQSFKGYNLFGKIAFDKKTGETIHVYCGSSRRKHIKPGGMPSTKYIPSGIRAGKREGAGWIGWHLEKLFFATISQALNIEGSVAGAEADLALAEEQLEDVKTRIQGVEEFLLDSSGDEDFDPSGILEKLKVQQSVLKFKKEQIEQLKETIHAGAGAIRLDLEETDRKKMIEVIRANVERIDLDCDKQEFRVRLMNGIEYEVLKEDRKNGKIAWRIDSKHFDAGEKKPFSTIKQLRKIQKKAA